MAYGFARRMAFPMLFTAPTCGTRFKRHKQEWGIQSGDSEDRSQDHRSEEGADELVSGEEASKPSLIRKGSENRFLVFLPLHFSMRIS